MVSVDPCYEMEAGCARAEVSVPEMMVFFERRSFKISIVVGTPVTVTSAFHHHSGWAMDPVARTNSASLTTVIPHLRPPRGQVTSESVSSALCLGPL